MNFAPSLGVLLAYSAAGVLLALTPGPDMALFLSRTLTGGRAAGLAALAGAMSGLLVHTLAAAIGLTALLAASPAAYGALKLAGALYLLWLAFNALRRGSTLPLDAAQAGGASLATSYWTGVGINLTNPKIILFFVTFLPQFIDAGDPQASQKLAFLGIYFILIGATLNAGVIMIAARFVAAARRHPGFARGFDYGFAGLMTAFALRLLASYAR